MNCHGLLPGWFQVLKAIHFEHHSQKKTGLSPMIQFKEH